MLQDHGARAPQAVGDAAIGYRGRDGRSYVGLWLDPVSHDKQVARVNDYGSNNVRAVVRYRVTWLARPKSLDRLPYARTAGLVPVPGGIPADPSVMHALDAARRHVEGIKP